MEEPDQDGAADEVEPMVDDGWAVVIATDVEEEAEAIHRRLRAGNIDSYIRDVAEDDRVPDQPGIQVIVPAEDVPAAMLELDLHLNIREAKGDPGRISRLAELGYEVDDLQIAELSATGGPEYELDELGSDDEVKVFLNVLEAERIRFALDRDANLIVHYNDEAKVDEVIERLFGFEDDDAVAGDDGPGPATSTTTTSTTTTRVADSEPGDGSMVAEMEPVIVVEPRREVVGPTAGIADIDGRPTVDDVTPDHSVITKPGPGPWIYLIAVLAVIVVLIVLVL